MSWREWTAALTRRWYVVLIGLLLTAGLLAASPLITPPQYAVRGLILLLPPTSTSAEGSNPFLSLGDLDLPARILVAYYSSNSAQDEIAATSPDAEVTVSIEESTRSPVIAIDVLDSSQQSAMKTLHFVADQIPGTLTKLQADVDAPTNTRVTSMVLTMDLQAKPDLTNLVRMLIAAGVGGLAFTVLLTFGIDGTLRRRRAEQADEPPDHPAGSSAAVPDRQEPGPADTASTAPAEPAPAEASAGAANREQAGTVMGHAVRRTSTRRRKPAGQGTGGTNSQLPVGRAEDPDLDDTLPLRA